MNFRYSLKLIGVSLLFVGCGMQTEQELILHYDKPAEFFEEALPIGNGRLGAMVYGGTDQERISLNDITLWTGEPEPGANHPDFELFPEVTLWGEASDYIKDIREALDAEDYRRADRLQRRIQGHFSENYQPLGTLRIKYGNAEITDYRRELNISDAVAKVSYLRNGKPFIAEYFVSAPDSAIVVSISFDEPLDLTLGMECQLRHTVTASGNRITVDGYAAYHSYPNYFNSRGHERFLYDPDRGIHFRTILMAETDGQITASDGAVSLTGARQVLIKIVNATSFNGFDCDPVLDAKPYKKLADANADRISGKSVEELKKAHIADYKSFFDRLSINLGKTAPEIKALPTDEQLKLYTDDNQANPELEALYFQYGRYLLISSSRTPGVPANLQGLWNESMEPPWSGNYTVNINLQENYWPAEPAALPEMHEVMLDFVNNMEISGSETARLYYGVQNGWAAGTIRTSGL